MQFKHPEILFALFLLIIPIIIHLFNFQRYKKEAFTNVQFLKNIQQQSRKSEQLKKLLLLVTRLLVFTNLIIAFAQPFWPNKTANKKIVTNVYLDNSFSTQAEGNFGSLFKNNVQKLIKATAFSKEKFNLYTNTKTYLNLSNNQLKNTLLKLDYTPKKLLLNTIFFKLNQSNKNKSNTLYKNILISDFQIINFNNKIVFTNVNNENVLIKTLPKRNQNYYIDSVFITNKKIDDILLNIVIKSHLKSSEKIAISLFNNNILYGKATCKFNNSTKENIQFSIPNTTNFLGKLTIDEDALSFDNTFYFTLNKPVKLNVLSIGQNSSFLSKIYTPAEFNYKNFSLQNLDYNQIQNQHTIILNQLSEINQDLVSFLTKFSQQGGNVVIIPSEKININSYNRLFKNLNIGQIKRKIEKKQVITTINFKHPLFNEVFKQTIKNFDYPKTNISYKTSLKNSLPILKYDSETPFMVSFKHKSSSIYWVNSPLDQNISNFTNSPLIVPIFYNIATQQFNTSNIYYIMDENTSTDINYKLSKNEVLRVKNEKTHFIPLQLGSSNKVHLNFQNQIQKSGFYQILSKNKLITTLAFNYNRDESKLDYIDLEKTFKNEKNITISKTISTVFEKLSKEQQINMLFKWFLALAILFLLLEIWIIKYFKP
jgi:hypothetical protein